MVNFTRLVRRAWQRVTDCFRNRRRDTHAEEQRQHRRRETVERQRERRSEVVERGRGPSGVQTALHPSWYRPQTWHPDFRPDPSLFVFQRSHLARRPLHTGNEVGGINSQHLQNNAPVRIIVGNQSFVPEPLEMGNSQLVQTPPNPAGHGHSSPSGLPQPTDGEMVGETPAPPPVRPPVFARSLFGSSDPVFDQSVDQRLEMMDSQGEQEVTLEESVAVLPEETEVVRAESMETEDIEGTPSILLPTSPSLPTSPHASLVSEDEEMEENHEAMQVDEEEGSPSYPSPPLPHGSSPTLLSSASVDDDEEVDSEVVVVNEREGSPSVSSTPSSASPPHPSLARSPVIAPPRRKRARSPEPSTFEPPCKRRRVDNQQPQLAEPDDRVDGEPPVQRGPGYSRYGRKYKPVIPLNYKVKGGTPSIRRK